MHSLVRRSRWLAFHLAVCHLPQLELRLRVVFWHLADRWGRVTPDGVVVPLRLTHELIGGLVGARRAPVTRALGRLHEAGVLERRREGGWGPRGRLHEAGVLERRGEAEWVLRGRPPEELFQTHLDAAGGHDGADTAGAPEHRRAVGPGGRPGRTVP